MNIIDDLMIEVGFTEETIFIKDKYGNLKSHPLEWFPKLMNATTLERLNFSISPFGIHWEDLDEDLSIEGFSNFSKN